MSSRPKKLPSALRHGAYSSFEILPGESAADFKRLHRELIAELIPTGPLEEDVVMTLTRLVMA